MILLTGCLLSQLVSPYCVLNKTDRLWLGALCSRGGSIEIKFECALQPPFIATGCSCELYKLLYLIAVFLERETCAFKVGLQHQQSPNYCKRLILTAAIRLFGFVLCKTKGFS